MGFVFKISHRAEDVNEGAQECLFTAVDQSINVRDYFTFSHLDLGWNDAMMKKNRQVWDRRI
jgi:hypothetical protein